ncbi:uncharacterized protein LOC122267964 [Penaeus japonicus]|uniref:uncharacterized protein LOC122267964 n=1 Tax=Penaeus japonicus TaxID=27405 RepID=UPI001C716C2A|nr:uncharacterized protein LOC122267964 [Penaeus japonicus]
MRRRRPVSSSPMSPGIRVRPLTRRHCTHSSRAVVPAAAAAEVSIAASPLTSGATCQVSIHPTSESHPPPGGPACRPPTPATAHPLGTSTDSGMSECQSAGGVAGAVAAKAVARWRTVTATSPEIQHAARTHPDTNLPAV